MKRYVVKQGECISSVAYLHGFFPETVWNDGANDALRALRKNPNALLPGDVVYIPELSEKVELCQTGKQHVFRRLSVPAQLQLRFLRDGEPRRGVPYRLTIDKITSEGFTNDDGEVVRSVMPDAKEGTLLLGEGDDVETYTLLLRELDPADTISGAQGRLRNLGYFTGAVDGVMNTAMEDALRRFQGENKLAETGQVDGGTAAALVTAHGG